MKNQLKNLLFVTIVSLALLVTKTAHAQVTFGARAGANLATEPVPNLYHVFLARPYAGVFAQFNIIAPFALQLGANYSGEGANYKDLATNDTYQIRHSFLTIPLLAQYQFPFGGYIAAGPQFGFLLSASAKTNNDAAIDSKSYYKGTDFGASVGIGYEFSGKTLTGFGFNIRYMRGLTNINKDNGDVTADNVKTRVLSIGVTYRIIK